MQGIAAVDAKGVEFRTKRFGEIKASNQESKQAKINEYNIAMQHLNTTAAERMGRLMDTTQRVPSADPRPIIKQALLVTKEGNQYVRRCKVHMA